jgi:hypothetical protein
LFILSTTVRSLVIGMPQVGNIGASVDRSGPDAERYRPIIQQASNTWTGIVA